MSSLIRKSFDEAFAKWSDSLEGLRVPPLEGSEIDVAIFGAKWALEFATKTLKQEGRHGASYSIRTLLTQLEE